MIKESKNHNEIFEKAQDKYLKDRTNANLSEMYLILIDYYQNQFINYSHKKGLYWNDDIINEKSEDASTRVIERYIRKPEFKIDRLTSYGHWDFIKILYQDAEWEQRTKSYEDYVADKFKIESLEYGEDSENE